MPKLLLVLTVAAIGLFPLSISAQETAPEVPPVEQMIEGLDSSRLVVIGAGLLIGALTMEVLVAGDLAILVGGVTGGVLTDWWYRKREAESMVPKAAYRFAADPPSQGLFKLAMLPRQ